MGDDVFNNPLKGEQTAKNDMDFDEMAPQQTVSSATPPPPDTGAGPVGRTAEDIKALQVNLERRRVIRTDLAS